MTGVAKLLTCEGTLSQVGTFPQRKKRKIGRPPRLTPKIIRPKFKLRGNFTKARFLVLYHQRLPDSLIAKRLDVRKVDVERFRKRMRLKANRKQREWWNWQELKI